MHPIHPQCSSPLRWLALAGLLLALLPACVSKKKFKEERYLVEQGERRERQLRAQLEYADEQIRYLTERNGELDQVIGVLRQEKRDLVTDTTRLGQRLRSLSDRSRMTREEMGSALETTQRQLRAANQRLESIENAVRQRDIRLQSAFTMLRDSLDSLQLVPPPEVVFEGGKIICGLRDQLLFGRSNFRISEEGMLILERVALVLNAFPDLEVLAVGHTSNQAAPQGYIDNWGLSARRAAALVRTLTEQYDVSANQLTAAGKGEFQPKVSNGTPEGQATNRRMEFVLSPRLDLLYRNILSDGP